MSITGFGPLGNRGSPYSYYFARNPVANGAWATWQRAWRHYDYDLTELARVAHVTLAGGRRSPAESGRLVACDPGRSTSHRATTGCGGCSIAGRRTGSGSRPARTSSRTSDSARTRRTSRNVGEDFFAVPTEEAGFPLRHPPVVISDHRADGTVWEFMYSISPLARRRHARWQRQFDRLPEPVRSAAFKAHRSPASRHPSR